MARMDDVEAPSLMSAKDLIAWRGGVSAAMPKNVILTHQESLFSALRARLGGRRVRGLFPQLYVLPRSDGRIAVAGRTGVGAPATAMAVEELAAAGVKRIVMVDVAASIAEGFIAGDLMAVETALPADGTSRRYLAAGTELVAGSVGLFATLRRALQNAEMDRGEEQRRASSGRVASTDAPFRETVALLDSFRAQEARLVDMETAALFASAAACGVEAAALLVVGDQLLGKWTPPPDRKAIHARLLDTVKVARAVLLE
jgi:uridine phosphorylase